MATSGTYVAEVSLKGSAEEHYKRWRDETHVFPDAIGHLIHDVSLHHGQWDSHGSIKIWSFTCDGKKEELKERREIDDEKMTLTAIGLEGHVMDELKVHNLIFQFYPKSNTECACKVTHVWEKRNEDVADPIRYFKVAKQMVVDMDNHTLKASPN